MEADARARRLMGLLAVAAALGLASCGGEDDPSGTEAPSDFALSFEYRAGSVPPPDHDEWTVEFDASGAGTATYVPDYPGEGVPTYRASFAVDEEQRNELFATLVERGALTDHDESEDPPIGGSTETATITADGREYLIPAFDSADEAPLDGLSDEVQGVVPAADWERFERQADQYARQEYSEVP